MKIVLLIVLSLCLPSRPAICSIEDGWKGIKVFHSTRQEVERILGKPLADKDDLKVNYETDEALVHVIYSTGACVDDSRGRGKYNLGKDIVIWYWVVMKKGIEIEDFDWQKELYQRSAESHVSGIFNYDSSSTGIRVETRVTRKKELISNIYFDATREMKEEASCN